MVNAFQEARLPFVLRRVETFTVKKSPASSSAPSPSPQTSSSLVKRTPAQLSLSSSTPASDQLETLTQFAPKTSAGGEIWSELREGVAWLGGIVNAARIRMSDYSTGTAVERHTQSLIALLGHSQGARRDWESSWGVLKSL
ncbi:hypothetical protein VNI00_015876 [Paramarasmius palmivorus]|uniref:Uncharacterized protein n=1 Tax=Paramarasmius palmivorus TaxID=297713 RepID=A0AAW0BI14_9AGAR